MDPYSSQEEKPERAQINGDDHRNLPKHGLLRVGE
jgi:hypothetical protein